jgi:hypothetical protein
VRKYVCCVSKSFEPACASAYRKFLPWTEERKRLPESFFVIVSDGGSAKENHITPRSNALFLPQCPTLGIVYISARRFIVSLPRRRKLICLLSHSTKRTSFVVSL